MSSIYHVPLFDDLILPIRLTRTAAVPGLTKTIFRSFMATALPRGPHGDRDEVGIVDKPLQRR